MITIIFSDMELLAANGQHVLFWSHMTYTCVPFIPVVWLLFCLAYSERGKKNDDEKACDHALDNPDFHGGDCMDK